jgi:hypothetical protein
VQRVALFALEGHLGDEVCHNEVLLVGCDDFVRPQFRDKRCTSSVGDVISSECHINYLSKWLFDPTFSVCLHNFIRQLLVSVGVCSHEFDDVGSAVCFLTSWFARAFG